MQKESDIQRAIIKWLNLQEGTFCWKNHTTGVPIGKTGKFRLNFNKGIADIVGVKNKRAFAFEVKKEGNKASDYQREWLEKFDKAGGYAGIVHSLDEAIDSFREV